MTSAVEHEEQQSFAGTDMHDAASRVTNSVQLVDIDALLGNISPDYRP